MSDVDAIGHRLDVLCRRWLDAVRDGDEEERHRILVELAEATGAYIDALDALPTTVDSTDL
jgi:hypothetical protein